MSISKLRVWPGSPSPMGATWDGRGVNFALFSENAEKVELVLFDPSGMVEIHRIRLTEYTNQVWHAYLPDIRPGQLYGYRVYGTYDPNRGHRFNHHKLLLDPYAKALFGKLVWNEALFGFRYGDPAVDMSFDTRDSAAFMPKCRVVEQAYTWGDDRHPNIPWRQTIIYETHVRGTTMLHPEVPAIQRGTFAGLASPSMVRYFQKLGVTALELLPVQGFIDEWHLHQRDLANYWGYNPIAFFVPHAKYFSHPDTINEFKTMIKVLHDAGLEVLLDVVYNHTAEGNQMGPTLSFRGIDNAVYYRLLPGRPRYYQDFTGCGNSFNLRHSRVLQLVTDSLRYWSEEMRVDGFRFDLTTTLAREADGRFNRHSGFLDVVAQDPVLAKRKLIAEAWDLGLDGYQVGGFPPGWTEWNDKYRDGVRRYWRNDPGQRGNFASRFTGSSDVFNHQGRRPTSSLNFITAHDGFTLYDLTAYSRKYNIANLEDNRDGRDENFSWNCGQEGESANKDVHQLRFQQLRNFFSTLMLSQGVPMIVGGDEFGRTQHGNNNPYCQDNTITWFNWENWTEDQKHLLEFVQQLIRFRRLHPIFHKTSFFTGQALDSKPRDIVWLRPDGLELSGGDWENLAGNILGVIVSGEFESEELIPCDHAPELNSSKDATFLLIINPGTAEVSFRLPLQGTEKKKKSWKLVLDTSRQPPFVPEQGLWQQESYLQAPHSLSMLQFVSVDGVWKDIPRPVHTANTLQELDQLARQAGIQDGYWDIFGKWQPIPHESRLAFLTALGLPCGTPGQVSVSLRSLKEAPWRRPLEPALVIHGLKGEIRIPIVVKAKYLNNTFEWAYVGENGDLSHGRLNLNECPLEDEIELEDRKYQRRIFVLPAVVPLGYHRFEITGTGLSGSDFASMALIRVPEACYIPPAMEKEEGRIWGTAVQLYALNSSKSWGVGDFSDLKALVAGMAAQGAGVVGLNPLHAQFPRHPEQFSPYSPNSRFFLNPVYIDCEAVPEFELCQDAKKKWRSPEFQALLEQVRQTPMVDYIEIGHMKLEIMRLLFKTFRELHLSSSSGEVPSARCLTFRQFVKDGGERLLHLALYNAMANHFGDGGFGGRTWRRWPLPFRSPGSPEVRRFAEQHTEEVEFFQYLYWTAHTQLKDVVETCKEQGMLVGLYNDIALGVDPDGADFWSNQRLFVDGARMGAPYDHFNPLGQDWGLPPLNPRVLKEDGYRIFAETLRATMSVSGAVRLDHVMGLTRLFWVPVGAKATKGGYVNYPFEDLLGIVKLESQRNRCLVVGEALGTVPEGLPEKLASANVFSYQLFYFEREPGGEFKHPDNYSPFALVAITTHDLPTFPGYWESVDLEEKRRLSLFPTDELLQRVIAERANERENIVHVLKKMKLIPNDWTVSTHKYCTDELMHAVNRYLSLSPSKIQMVQLEDVIGQREQVNLPGTTNEHPNWQRKLAMSVEAIISSTAMLALTKVLRKQRPPLKKN
ncbi:MAG: glycogen debranching protein GlgX [Magnetococcales bacterium]|nr:glycogen debranching protein GlgX [Magnetococcales bacterium]